MDEVFDVLDDEGQPTGQRKRRADVHKDGDWHRAVHVWLYSMDTGELLIQKRAPWKDSWAGLWDISAAGHVTAGDASLQSAVREVHEELGIKFPPECSVIRPPRFRVKDRGLCARGALTAALCHQQRACVTGFHVQAFEPLFTFKLSSTCNDGTFINNEFDDVYLVTVKAAIPTDVFVLDETEVESVRWIPHSELRERLARRDPAFVPVDTTGQYSRLFEIVADRARKEGLPGSGIHSFMHTEGARPAHIQCVTFDAPYLKLVPPEQR